MKGVAVTIVEANRFWKSSSGDAPKSRKCFDLQTFLTNNSRVKKLEDISINKNRFSVTKIILCIKSRPNGLDRSYFSGKNFEDF